MVTISNERQREVLPLAERDIKFRFISIRAIQVAFLISMWRTNFSVNSKAEIQTCAGQWPTKPKDT